MQLTTLMNTSPQTLAATQHKELEKHVIHRLQEVIGLIRKKDYEKLHTMLVSSPSGDCMGLDNHYIDFSYDKDSYDILQVIDWLECLNKQAKDQ